MILKYREIYRFTPHTFLRITYREEEMIQETDPREHLLSHVRSLRVRGKNNRVVISRHSYEFVHFRNDSARVKLKFHRYRGLRMIQTILTVLRSTFVRRKYAATRNYKYVAYICSKLNKSLGSL